MNARRSLYALDPWLLPPVVWGGFELQRSYGKAAPEGTRLGESWEASCITGRESRIRGESRTLRDAFLADPAHFLGADAGEGSFPLLIKLLATAAPLSVQVHPSDEHARAIEGAPTGKHEAWVVLKAEPEAVVFAGLRDGVTTDDLCEAAGRGDAEAVLELLLAYDVQAGDVVEVPPGCVHAPGPGLVLYEAQQPSDLTYRIYDWGRVGLDGKPRPLHVEKARIAIDPDARPTIGPESDGDLAIETPAFAVERWKIDAPVTKPPGGLRAITCAAGRGTLRSGGCEVTLLPGATCLVPAGAGDLAIDGTDFELLSAAPS